MVKKCYIALSLLTNGALINAMTLHEAAQVGDVPAILTLLNEGVNVDLQNAQSSYQTPLYCAVKAGQLEAARCLLMYGADANKKIKEKDPHLICVLTALHQAAVQGNKDLINLLLDYHAYVDVEDNNKMTPLFFAVILHNFEAIRTLLDHGADVRHKNKNDDEPMMMVSRASFENVVEVKELLHKYIERLERPRILAFLMALHPRLGKDSPANILPGDGSIHKRILRFLCGEDQHWWGTYLLE